MSIVIVGGGHAAGQCIANLRQAKFDGEITLVGSEPHIPYQRPPLSKQFLKSEVGEEKVILRPESFYQKQDIRLALGVTVINVDSQNKVVECDDGATRNFDSLIFATGSAAIRPPIDGIDVPGVHLLRTIDDVHGIKNDLEGCEKAVIVGGGYIGLEVAASLTELGVSTSIVELEERVLKRVATPEMSQFYHKLHTDQGVCMYTRDGVEQIISGPDNRVAKVKCQSGTELSADLVVIGVGIKPNVELAAQTGLPVDNGIVVDEWCRTADPNIFAIGDCTNHPNALLDKRLRLESVPNAMGQAKTAAFNICGRTTVYNEYPWFWSDQYDLKLQMAGFTDRFDEHVTRGDKSEKRFINFYVTDGKLTATEAVNVPRDFLAARQLLGKPITAKELADSNTDLKELMQRS